MEDLASHAQHPEECRLGGLTRRHRVSIRRRYAVRVKDTIRCGLLTSAYCEGLRKDGLTDIAELVPCVAVNIVGATRSGWHDGGAFVSAIRGIT